VSEALVLIAYSFGSAVDTTAATTLSRSASSCCYESAPSRNSLHLRHGHARHARARLDRAGVAETDPRLSRRQHELGRDVERNFRHRLRPDAVFLFARARRFIRQIRPP